VATHARPLQEELNTSLPQENNDLLKDCGKLGKITENRFCPSGWQSPIFLNTLKTLPATSTGQMEHTLSECHGLLKLVRKSIIMSHHEKKVPLLALEKQ